MTCNYFSVSSNVTAINVVWRFISQKWKFWLSVGTFWGASTGIQIGLYERITQQATEVKYLGVTTWWGQAVMVSYNLKSAKATSQPKYLAVSVIS